MWHLKKDGTGVDRCDAKKRDCPNGGDTEHFSTKEQAMSYVEKKTELMFQQGVLFGEEEKPVPVRHVLGHFSSFDTFPTGPQHKTTPKEPEHVDVAALEKSPAGTEDTRSAHATLATGGLEDSNKEQRDPKNVLSDAPKASAWSDDAMRERNRLIRQAQGDFWNDVHQHMKDTNAPEISVENYIARNPNVPLRFIKKAYELHPDGAVYGTSLASSEKTPVNILKRLAFSNQPWVRMNVAKNPKTPQRLLHEMVKDESYEIRKELAGRKNVSPYIARSLVKDNSVNVRLELSANPDASVSVLDALAEDKDNRVRLNVAKNPSTSSSTLIKLATPHEYMRQYKRHYNYSSWREEEESHFAVVDNPKAPMKALSIVASLPDSEFEYPKRRAGGNIRAKIAKHPNVSLKTLELLYQKTKKNSSLDDVGTLLYIASNPKTLRSPLLVKDIVSHSEDRVAESMMKTVKENNADSLRGMINKDDED